MQIRNNYDKEVFNGDIGRVQNVNMEDRSLTVIYEGRAVEYEDNELDEVTLAYATTIHKSQGSHRIHDSSSTQERDLYRRILLVSLPKPSEIGSYIRRAADTQKRNHLIRLSQSVNHLCAV